MGSIRRSWLSLALVGVLVTTSYSCATGATQEQECRRARGRAVGKAIGALTVGVLLLAVFVASAAGGGNPGGLGRRRRDRARRRGLSVCRDAPPDMERTTPVAPPPTPPSPPPATADPGPPSRDDLQAGFAHIEPQLRSCVGEGATGTLYIDANLVGSRGHVDSFTIDGDPAIHANTACLSRALAQLRYPTFGGTVRVRWALPLARSQK